MKEVEKGGDAGLILVVHNLIVDVYMRDCVTALGTEVQREGGIGVAVAT